MDGSESTPPIGFWSNGPPPLPVRFMICTPIFSKRFMIALAGLVLVLVVERDDRDGSGPIAEAPTMNAAWVVALMTSPPTPLEFSP